MKILVKKLKKSNLAKRIIFYITSILLLISTIYFIYGITHITIETGIRIAAIIFFVIWFIIYLIFGLTTIITKKTWVYILLTTLSIIFIPIQAGSSYIINYLYGSLENMNQETVTYRTNLISLKDTKLESNSIIGMLDTENDIESVILPKELMKRDKMKNEIKYYEDFNSMILALYNEEIDACFVKGNYTIMTIETEDGKEITTLEEDTKILSYLEKDMKNQDTQTLSKSKNKTLTEPFTVLVMGVDSEYDGLKANQSFNGDTLIMITFNPKTLTATMFSLPRDIYVPIACNHNRYAKINSSAAYGSTCVINTIQNLTGITIDYYVKMNFTGVVDLVDALGGVEVDVATPNYTWNMNIDCHGGICEQNSKREWGNKTIYIKPGLQTLDGEEALAYARNRHQWATGDLARNQHQQQVIEAVANKAKGIKSIGEFQDIMDAITRNLETNMTPDQIMSFYEVGKDMLLNTNTNSLSIKKTYLNCYNLGVWRGSSTTSALGYYPESLNAIIKLMKQNLGLEKIKPNKTFSINYDEDYKVTYTGQNVSGGEILTLIPRFTGNTVSYANEWCNNNGYTCNFEYVPSTEVQNIVLTQSIHQNSLMKEIYNKTINFTVSNGNGTSTSKEISKQEENLDDEDETSSKESTTKKEEPAEPVEEKEIEIETQEDTE